MITRTALVALALAAGTASAADVAAGSASAADTPSAATHGTGDFAAGNRAAMSGDFKAAAAAFERPLAHGWSPGTLFDLGNAYASAGDAGHAILAYERARVLAPSDPVIAANLAQVRAEAGVTTARPGAIARTLAVLTPDDWTWLAIAGGVLACAGIVVAGWSTRRRLARTLIAAGALGALACAFAAARTVPPADRAIVVTRTQARIAPAPVADPSFTAPAGEAVMIEQRHGDFVYVRDGEHAGWLPRGAVELVIPG
jgi:tetratricopeptide (TPR) repeat protein